MSKKKIVSKESKTKRDPATDYIQVEPKEEKILTSKPSKKHKEYKKEQVITSKKQETKKLVCTICHNKKES